MATRWLRLVCYLVNYFSASFVPDLKVDSCHWNGFCSLEELTTSIVQYIVAEWSWILDWKCYERPWTGLDSWCRNPDYFLFTVSVYVAGVCSSTSSMRTTWDSITAKKENELTTLRTAVSRLLPLIRRRLEIITVCESTQWQMLVTVAMASI